MLWGLVVLCHLMCLRKLERFREQLLHVAREISHVTKPRLRPCPSGRTTPRGVKHPGRRVHGEAFLCDDASFLVPGVRATELQRVPCVTGAQGRRGLCKDSGMCFCCHLSSAVGTAQGLLAGDGKPGPVTAPHPEENKCQAVDVPQWKPHYENPCLLTDRRFQAAPRELTSHCQVTFLSLCPASLKGPVVP